MHQSLISPISESKEDEPPILILKQLPTDLPTTHLQIIRDYLYNITKGNYFAIGQVTTKQWTNVLNELGYIYAVNKLGDIKTAIYPYWKDDNDMETLPNPKKKRRIETTSQLQYNKPKTYPKLYEFIKSNNGDINTIT